VTAVLYLSGSGSNISGSGVLLKTAPEHYRDALIRDPGALKIAQAGNPERWGPRMQRAWMNWNTRDTIRRGQAYARAWAAFERAEGPEPERNPSYDVFRAIQDAGLVVAVHTQIYQVVLMSLTMLREELGLPIFLAHGTFDGYRLAGLAEELDVPAIVGPRSMNRTLVGVFAGIDTDGRFEGIAAGYQERGHTRIGFNTDAINPDFGLGGPWQEELPLQAAMGARYGMTDERLELLRGLTIVPAVTVGIEDRLGSLEPGKDADLVVVDGDPADPRERVRQVWVEGRLVYDRDQDPTVW
jgi:imidazolonepropionase-like amidohydrolase